MKLLSGIFSAILLTAFFAGSASAHRYHTSLTRMDYNQREKLVEVSIQLFTHDLEQVLEKLTKKRIDLEKTAKIDGLIFDYLKTNFVIKDKNGAAKNPVWVGKELKADAALIYLEIPLEAEPSNFSLQNSIFFESFPEQTNLVTARFDEKKSDLLFKVGDKFKEIKLDEK